MKKNKDKNLKKTNSTEPEKETKVKKSAWRENIEAILIAIVIAIFIRTFLIQAFKIPSGSMMDTLLIGDQILVNKFIYGVKMPFSDGKTLIPFKNPEIGDIVVFIYPEDRDKSYFKRKDFIKRVVATEGDSVEIINKKLYVNDRLVPQEPYACYKDPRVIPSFASSRDNMAKKIVPEGSLFVMGDNRDNSHDSRFWGFVDLKLVKGEAFIIYWSWDKENFGVRWNRLGDLLN